MQILNKILNFIKKYPIELFLFFVILCMGAKILYLNHKLDKTKIETVINDGKNGKVDIINYDKELGDLKKENRELYDTIKKYKDDLKLAYQFKYKKQYSIDTVFIDTTKIDELKTYNYKTENDSIKYNLTIGSLFEPNWFKLDFEVKDKFTIINNKLDKDKNETIIKSDVGAEITDVTVFNNKDKKSIIDKFKVRPAVTGGYDLINKQFGVMVGASIVFDW